VLPTWASCTADSHGKNVISRYSLSEPDYITRPDAIPIRETDSPLPLLKAASRRATMFFATLLVFAAAFARVQVASAQTTAVSYV
jgi:hypothetical protein